MTTDSTPEDVYRAPCPFCAIIRREAPATIVRQWGDAMAIVPLNPVTPGHLLVIPVDHIRDASESPYIAGQVMARAAELAKPPFNIITSAGAEATQTVFHLHVHVVPRTAGDGLALPWAGGADRDAAYAAGVRAEREAAAQAIEAEADEWGDDFRAGHAARIARGETGG